MSRAKNLKNYRLHLLDVFTITTAASVLLTRLFLEITGYPQLGGRHLHIAHMLWGGLFITTSFLYLLLSVKPKKAIACITGGIGLGLFIDEIGKFITRTNDYFFRPTAFLIYTILLLIWFVCRLVIVRQTGSSFFNPTVWPSSIFIKIFISTWSIMQALVGSIIVWSTLIYGLDRVAIYFDTSRLLVLPFLIYSLAFIYAIFCLAIRQTLVFANTIRLASLFSLVAVYPQLFLHEKFSASFGLLLTLLVIAMLSGFSIKDLLKS